MALRGPHRVMHGLKRPDIAALTRVKPDHTAAQSTPCCDRENSVAFEVIKRSRVGAGGI
jgi:hypothetical protein